jgi:protein O-GlcNAc transferase
VPLPATIGGRAIELVQREAYATAIPQLRRALAAGDLDPTIRFALAGALFKLGYIEAALGHLRQAARSTDSAVRRDALKKIAIAIPGDPRADNEQILKARRKWIRLESENESPRFPVKSLVRAPDRRLRVGYVCAFFGYRNWMKPVWGVLNAHDRSAFEIHLFLDGGLPRPENGYTPNEADRIHSLDSLSNEDSAKCICAAEIDILVDLNAYSFPNRIGLFLRKPAPIQVGWFNTYATSGTDAFDYAIADRVVLPSREARFYTERILRVNGSYLAFSASYRVPDVAPPPCMVSRRITFGCLAPNYKLTREVVAAFASILRAVPSARLVLKNRCLAESGNLAAVRARFRREAIADDQLICEGPAEHFEFLKTYGQIDVALDTFPYSGGTTTMEALWQGVPVLTFLGDRWVSRTSSSLLRAAGLNQWVRPSRDSFVRYAIALAKSPDTIANLSALRSTLREKLRATAACDVAGLCGQLESHYQAIAGNVQVSRERQPSESSAPASSFD